MQTFLPHADFAKSAEVLDRARLGKQRVEVLQLLQVNLGGDPKAGWYNHPAAKMWRGWESWLVTYGVVICNEWKRRGYADTCLERILALDPGTQGRPALEQPCFLGDEAFHLSHQSNLVRKMPEHYRQFFPDVPDDLPYVWPVMEV